MREAGTSGRWRTAIGHGVHGLPQPSAAGDPGSKPPRPKRNAPRSKKSSACFSKPEQPQCHDVSCPRATTAARSASHNSRRLGPQRACPRGTGQRTLFVDPKFLGIEDGCLASDGAGLSQSRPHSRRGRLPLRRGGPKHRGRACGRRGRFDARAAVGREYRRRGSCSRCARWRGVVGRGERPVGAERQQRSALGGRAPSRSPVAPSARCARRRPAQLRQGRGLRHCAGPSRHPRGAT